MNHRQNWYAKRLKDPRWQRKRLEILNRDDWACRICFDTETCLHVHHRIYLSGRDPWDVPNELLVTLCEDCHQAETMRDKPLAEKMLKVLKRHLFSHDYFQVALVVDCLPQGQYPNEVMLSGLAWFVSDPDRLDSMMREFFADKCNAPARQRPALQDFYDGIRDSLVADGEGEKA